MSGPPLVVRGDLPAAKDAALVGGKASGLARLREMAQPVPPFYVVTTAAFRSGPGDIPADILAAIDAAHAECFPEDPYVAVRSSVVGEDGADASFAGLHDSFLYVRGRERLLRAIRDVWASGSSERSQAYRKRKGLPLEGVSVAVVVQAMIPPRASGVLFTVDPLRPDSGSVLLSALPGAGDLLVSGGATADAYEVRRDTFAVKSQIAEKPVQSVLDQAAGGGVRQEPVPEAARRLPCLSDIEAREAARAGLAIEAGLGGPQDVEFCFDRQGRLFVLQTRPVTALPQAGERRVWDNSNIIESYAGVTTPMTFSFIRRAYAIVYRCFLEVMGVPPKTIHHNRDVVENMLGLFRGRVYYNLVNWYRLVRLFPGYRFNKGFMEGMMGLKEPLDLKGEGPAPGFLRKYFVELPALFRLAARTAWKFLRIRTHVARFEELFHRHYGSWSKLDFRDRSPEELLRLYREMEESLLWNWKAPIINDFFVMIFYGTLRSLCRSWCGDATESLQNDLLSAQGGIESAEPARLLLEMAATARQDPVLLERLRRDPPDALAREIPADPRFAPFAAQLKRYIDVYGLRCMDELKLEEPPLRDRPGALFEILRNYLDLPPAEPPVRPIREPAEARAFAPLGFFRRRIFRVVLTNARLGVRNRENLRLLRTRVYGLLRDLLRALGARFAGAGVLEKTDDVFYLTLDELRDFVKGSAVTTDLRGLVSLRRKEFDAYRREEAPADRFETIGVAYQGTPFRHGPAVAAAGGSLLQGTGCSPGEVEGTVIALRTPPADLRLSGQILAAERTDPGWVVFFPCISGLLVERGSLLSHSCIVAREMGVPTIVKIPGLLDRISTGRRVMMNGSLGTIRILDP